MTPQKDEPPLLHETKALNPWQPETDKIRLAVLGKLAEELGEASAIVARCIIQGIDEREPVTGVRNRIQLEKELADVQATIIMAVSRFGLNMSAERRMRKMAHLNKWHELIAPAIDPTARLCPSDGSGIRDPLCRAEMHPWVFEATADEKIIAAFNAKMLARTAESTPVTFDPPLVRTGHTKLAALFPTPWKVSERSQAFDGDSSTGTSDGAFSEVTVTAANGSVVYQCYDANEMDGEQWDGIVALAHLIAAAPELYAAVADFLEWGPMTGSDRDLFDSRFRAALALAHPRQEPKDRTP